jgi:hypothetical protein
MASKRQLKKKINQQSFKILHLSLLFFGNQNNKEKMISDLLEDSFHFQQESLNRLNVSRSLGKSERKAELRAIAEQVRDKETYFEQTIISASR